jgi:ribosome maturation factor RimP
MRRHRGDRRPPADDHDPRPPKRHREPAAGRRRLPERLLETLAIEAAQEHGAELVTFRSLPGDEVRIIAAARDGATDVELLIALVRTYRRLVTEAGGDPDAMHIEIDSPGIDRPLTRDEHYVRFATRRVRIERLGAPLLRGTLLGLVEGEVVVRDDAGVEHRIARSAVREARLDEGPPPIRKPSR